MSRSKRTTVIAGILVLGATATVVVAALPQKARLDTGRTRMRGFLRSSFRCSSCLALRPITATRRRIHDRE